MGAHVVIVGAGYAGVMAAKRLLHKPTDITVTVVNPRKHLVQRIRLHQMIAGNYDVTVPLEAALPPQATLVIATATRIDTATNHLILEDGDTLPYDYLVYAPGSHHTGSTIAGAATHGFAVSEYEDAVRLKSRLTTLPTDAAITVVGGGLTGIETAAELAENRTGRTTLVTGSEIAPELSKKARSRIAGALMAFDIRIVTGSRVVRIDEKSCTLDDGRTIATDCAVLATEFGVPELARHSGLPVDGRGRLQVNRHLECTTHPNIVGAGDAMVISDLSLRMSCQAAIPLGVHAAETVELRLQGSMPTPVIPKFVGQCISLGRSQAVFQRITRSDVSARLVVSGRLGAFVKEGICLSTTLLGINRDRGFFYSWA
ncbi:oxidoreductase [Rhodococcus sp. KBS0724]|uniref:NAD(P)/FAD-dependent oxidoreductase n=1 Tax=Rhodococcus sp. KBS0724 TaxID=1179674 RepID=UPI00110DDAE5|nr:FAD-dependent oxidoreductase [Rhodococcus sp. KBS0724]TSD46837.1 oxidoreductase [Rhodococcus sp. KBS0724]